MKFAVRQSLGEEVLEYDGTQESQMKILELAYSTLPTAFFHFPNWVGWVATRYGLVTEGYPSAGSLLGLLADLRDEGCLELTLHYVDGAPVWLVDQLERVHKLRKGSD